MSGYNDQERSLRQEPVAVVAAAASGDGTVIEAPGGTAPSQSNGSGQLLDDDPI